jgi:prevent-host-death family protein
MERKAGTSSSQSRVKCRKGNLNNLGYPQLYNFLCSFPFLIITLTTYWLKQEGYMINTKEKEIAVSKFKAKCLGLLDEVQTSGQEIIVTKYGKPVAKVVPLDEDKEGLERFNKARESIKIKGDIVSPLGKEVWSDLQ